MTIVAIHHVQITIPPRAEAKARVFYCALLGLAEVAKPEALMGRGGFWLQVGDRQVHVGVEEGVDRSCTKAHVAYQVDDLSALRGRLEEAGVVIKASVAIPGVRRLEIRDPFGNRVEFVESLEEGDRQQQTGE